MKKISHKHITAATAALAMLTLSASCSQDGPAETDKAQVTMTFSTRAMAPAAEAGGLDENEQMRTLRVIVARQDGEIVHNATYDIQPEETSKTITFNELTVNAAGEDFTFYALANEDGTGKAGGFADTSVSELNAFSMTAAQTLGDLDALTYHVPQTAVRTITVKPQDGGGIQRETIPLDFAVAKVLFTVVNTSEAQEHTVSDISLSSVNLTSTPLFVTDGHTPAGDNTGTATLADITAAAGGEAASQCYIYENADGNYVLTATWNGTHHTISLDDYGITSIPRGTMLNITVTLIDKVDATVAVRVDPWEEKNMYITYE